MAPFYIHPGMHKTGTSSIQDSLAGSPDVLAAAGYRYIQWGKPNSANIINRGFATSPPSNLLARDPDGYAESFEQEKPIMRAHFRSLLLELNGLSGIFSAEALGGISPEGKAEFVAFLKDAGISDLRVRGYLRPPRSYMASSIQQRLRAGNPVWGGTELLPKYRGTFGEFEGLVDDDKLEFRLFERASLREGCVVRDFADWIGFAFPADRVIVSNEAISLPAIRILHCHRKLGRPFVTKQSRRLANAAFNAKLRLFDGPKLRLHPNFVAGLVDQIEPEIRWAESHLGRSVSDAEDGPRDGIENIDELLDVGQVEAEWLQGCADLLSLSIPPPRTPEQVSAAVESIYDRLQNRETRRAFKAIPNVKPRLATSSATLA